MAATPEFGPAFGNTSGGRLMFGLFMRATGIAAAVMIGLILYLVYKEGQTPQWPTAPTAPTSVAPPASPTAPLSPLTPTTGANPTAPPAAAPDAGAIAAGAAPPASPAAAAPAGAPPASPNPLAATPPANTAPVNTAPGSGGTPDASSDPLASALQRLRQGGAPDGSGNAQMTVSPPPQGATSPPPGSLTPPPGAAGQPPSAGAGADAFNPGGPPPGLAPPGLDSPGANTTPLATGLSLPPPVPLAPTPLAPPGGAAPPGATPGVSEAGLPNATGSGTRWSITAGNGGMTLGIALGGGQVAQVSVAPQFANLDRAGMDGRVDWLRQTILSRWGAQSGAYIYRRDGTVFQVR